MPCATKRETRKCCSCPGLHPHQCLQQKQLQVSVWLGAALWPFHCRGSGGLLPSSAELSEILFETHLLLESGGILQFCPIFPGWRGRPCHGAEGQVPAAGQHRTLYPPRCVSQPGCTRLFIEESGVRRGSFAF